MSQEAVVERAEDFEAAEEPWSHPSGATVVVQNVVATVNLRVPIDLKKVALSARNAEYNPKKFAAVIMRIRDPRCTALVFSTGKMVVTGAKSEQQSRQGARKFAAIVKKLGYAPKFSEFKIQNMVATADVGFPIRLEALTYAHAKFSSYEPELFPGLVYRLVNPKTVLLIFVSGRLVITGGKALDQLHTAFDKMYPVICEFKKETRPHPGDQPALPSTDPQPDDLPNPDDIDAGLSASAL
mmetsp:Transcript_2621/g.8179  ORF Transcript_2621/g.8179 Transcript_2621/m.8179 type:complete len:240 (+) Transcript_2621:111-830(+)